MKFYDNTIKDIYPCKKYPFHPHSTTTESKNLKSCQEIIFPKFWKPSIMKSMLCLIEETIRLSSPPSKEKILRLDKPQWLQVSSKEVSRGANGVAYKTISFYGFPLLVKVSLNAYSIYDLIHEGLIGLLGTNSLRSQTPCFAYTFSLFEKRNYQKNLVTEYVNGETFRSLLRSSRITKTLLLTIILQVLISLEIAQQKIGFSHFDLHNSNILVRNPVENQPAMILRSFQKTYVFKKKTPTACIIDFGHSCIEYKDGYLGRIDSGGFPEYGMYPFIVPGADMFKFMFHVYRDLDHSKNKDLTMFVRNLLEEFYGKRLQELGFNILQDPEEGTKDYFNCTTTSMAFLTPQQMIDFIWNKNYVEHLVNPVQNPLIYQINPKEKPDIRATQQQKKCLENLFCYSEETSSIINKKSQPPTKPSQILKDFIQSKLDSTIPTLLKKNKESIKAFVADREWTEVMLLNTSLIDINRAQRIYKCLKAYLDLLTN